MATLRLTFLSSLILELLATVSVCGGHILSSGNSITSSVKPENFLAMVRTTQQFGAYPIDLSKLK